LLSYYIDVLFGMLNVEFLISNLNAANLYGKISYKSSEDFKYWPLWTGSYYSVKTMPY